MQSFIFLNCLKYYATQPNPLQPAPYKPKQHSVYQASKY